MNVNIAFVFIFFFSFLEYQLPFLKNNIGCVAREKYVMTEWLLKCTGLIIIT